MYQNEHHRSVEAAIAYAETVLPGNEDDESRWPAIIAVCDFVESDPEPIWQFITKWGIHPDKDLRMAIACVGLEHLLEHHFELYFPRVALFTKSDQLFADTFSHCWKFGQAESVHNALRFDALRTGPGFSSPGI